MTGERALPPVWLMGFCNLPVGLVGGVTLVTVPQLLAAQGVPEWAIAWVTATSLIASFTSFLFAPILDWRLTRRDYAILSAVLTGLLSFAVLLSTTALVPLAILSLLAVLAANLNQASIGGWLSGVTAAGDKSILGAWMQAANIIGFGLGAAVAIPILRGLPPVAGPAVVAALQLLPIPLYLWLPAIAADKRLAHENFASFLRDVLSLARQPVVRWLLFFLAMPAASFALSNTLSGLGKDFGASEEFVGTVAGIGVAIAGAVGCVLVPPILRFLAPEWTYLMIGTGGAVLTLAQLAVPLNPLTFAFGMISQNGIQAAAYAAVNVLILRSNGEHNPLAATQFALLNAATGLPLAYMQAIDGQAYGVGGLSASYLADALISLAACALLGGLLWRRGRVPGPVLSALASE